MPPDAHFSLLTRTVDALIRWRWPMLVMSLLVTIAAWPIAGRLAFEQSIESLYASDDPHLLHLITSRKVFGGDELLVVAFTVPDLFQSESDTLTEAASQRIADFAAQLSRVPGVMPESTQHLAQALRFPWGRERIRNMVEGFLLGNDRQTTAIILRLQPERESPVSRGETIAQVRQLADSHDPPALVAGEPAQIHDMFRYVEQDGRKLFVVSMALLALVLMLLLDKLRWVVLPMLIVIVSITWTEAILVLSQMRLSMVSSMLNSLITIIGVATSMHISLHFRELHRTLSPAAALRQAMIELAHPVWWAVATTAFGFGVLLTSHVNPVSSFGVMMAIGSLVVLMAVIFLLPGCVLFGTMLPEPQPTAMDRRIAAILTRVTLWVEHHPRRVVLVSLAVFVFAFAGFARLRVETDFSKNFRSHSPIVQSLRFVETKLGGAGTWEINFPAPPVLTSEYLDKVRNFAEQLRREFAVDGSTDGKISKVVALTDGLDLIPEKLLFKTFSLEARLEFLSGFQREFVSSLFNPEAGRMRLLLRAYERQPSETKLALIDKVRSLAKQTFPDANNAVRGNPGIQPPDQSPQATGLFVLLAFLIESLMNDQWTSFILSTVGITSMMWFAFRNLPIGLMSLVPNVFPNVLVIGLMGWIGLPVNIATAMIACVSMGLTVDSSIIYVDGYLRARATGLRVHEALHETHRGVGRSLIYSNLALMAGFSVLALSHFIPLVYFGLLVSLAMFGGLIGNLVFLPLMLGWWDGRTERAISS